MSASHNQKCGYKAYGNDGGQLVSARTNVIIEVENKECG
jgi:phosphomannomutase